LKGSETGGTSYQESHSVTTNEFDIVNLAIAKGTPRAGNFATIDWSANAYYLKIKIDKLDGAGYVSVGSSELLAVLYALYALDAGGKKTWKDSSGILSTQEKAGIGTSTPSGMLTVQGTSTLKDTALFGVTDKQGRSVFAVYENGAEVYVFEDTKGGRGGFAVGGRTGSKGNGMREYFNI
jgi:hypothetical protein